MRELGACKPCAEFLVTLWSFDNARPFECFRIVQRGARYPEWSVPAADRSELAAILEELERDHAPADVYFGLHPLSCYKRNLLTALGPVGLDIDATPLDEALEHLGSIGVTPHVVTETSPGRHQAFLMVEPARLGRENRDRELTRRAELVRRLAELAGADPHATAPAQCFRVPGIPRVLADGGTFVPRVVQVSHHRAYTPRQLAALLPQRKRKTRLRWPSSDIPAGRVLDSPGVRWLRSHCVRDGCRNAAAVALCYAACRDGLTEGEALQLISEAVQRWQSSETYREAELAATVRSCYRHPRGLDPERLRLIEDVDHHTMTERQAWASALAMRQHARKPVDDLQRLPAFVGLARVLQAIARQQQATRTPTGRRRHRGAPVTSSLQDIANRSGVPLGTVKRRIAPALDRLQVRQVVRRGSSHVSTFDLRPLNQRQAYRDCIRCLGYQAPAGVVAALWRRRFVASAAALASVLVVAAMLSGGAVSGETLDPQGMPVDGERCRPGSRAPPVAVLEASEPRGQP